ncbi:hypothetical protein [Pseudomonas phage PhL_UNISO_PA-DSM_ph0034]|uniref:Uncharacterized protein n=1 Tax=Pseudomonas phage PhL_UNISO_PA-DSM_ph0034 TaxID=2812900 RepID=A0A9E6U401_9CAUD|nr:hypothetical protein QE329_gp037 [Pseudomonas phage PhL_UNISO_PA-DSM_ph0034]QYC95157.1 hypothetical protein [Pseudomonas phage PhL_UNISO_PA-DSM_ph0034]
MAEFFLGAALASLFFMFSITASFTAEDIEKVTSTCENNEGVKYFGVDFFGDGAVHCNSGAIFKIDRKSK